MNDIFAILFFLSFILFIVGLIKPSVYGKFIKNPSRKKNALIFGIAIVVFFILFGITADPASTKSTQKVEEVKVEKDEKSEEAPKKDKTNNDAISDYGLEMLEVIAEVQLGNEAIIKTGEYGQDLNFEIAQIYLDQAEKSYNLANQKFNKITPPPGTEKIHSLMKQALAKYIQSVDLYQQGLKSLDADKINEGVVIYSDATALVREATLETEKLAEKSN